MRYNDHSIEKWLPGWTWDGHDTHPAGFLISAIPADIRAQYDFPR